MNTYYIDYISSMDDDVAHVWVSATSKEDAIDQARHEYWDIKEIISVRKR